MKSIKLIKKILPFTFLLYLCLFIETGCNFDNKFKSPNDIIEIIGNSEISAGEEIVLNARNIDNYDNLKYYAKFEWFYGDGCVSSGDTSVTVGNGMAVSHIYALPGNYTVTLRISITDGDSVIASDEVSKQITVTGSYPSELAPLTGDEPVFSLDFNNSNMDFSVSSGSSVSVQLIKNGTSSTPVSSDFTNGILGKALDLTNGNYIKINNLDTALNGLNQFTISFWIKKKSYSSLSHLADSDTSYIMCQKNGTLRQFYLGINGAETFNAFLNTSDTSASVSALSAFKNGYFWQHCALTYDGSVLRLYINGIEYKGNYPDGMITVSDISGPLSLAGTLLLSGEPLYIGVKDETTGYSVSDRSARFNGYFDEFKIYDTCLTREQLFVGFELWHADFHSRIAQYIEVKIPDKYREVTTNKITATITNGGSYTRTMSLNNTGDVLTLIDSTNTNLSSTENILLNNYLLPSLSEPKKYTLTVKILNASNKVLVEKKEKFSKPYPGSPMVGIDENNTIRIGNNSNKGEAFFPVTCFGLTDNSSWEPDKRLKNWTSNALDASYGYNEIGQKWENPVINCGFGHGFSSDVTPDQFTSYLNDAENDGIKAIGPMAWEGQVSYTSSKLMGQNSDINNMIEYVKTNRNHLSMLMWSWKDEPDLGGIRAETLRAWTKISHIYDPQHPVAATLRGASFVPSSVVFMRSVQSYLAQFNAVRFGKITEPLNGIYAVDVLGYDYYPFDWAEPHTLDASIVETISALENSKSWSRNMIPHYDFIETTDINESQYTPYFPSPTQLKMLTWLHVIHGMKMVSWFHYRSWTPDINFRFMGEFVNDMDYFKNILAAPDSTRNVSVSINISDIGLTWGTGKSYTAGNLIKKDGLVYYCRRSHTSSSENEPGKEDTVMLWKKYWKTERRIDILVKELNNHIYIFAVRPTETKIGRTYYTPSNGDPFYTPQIDNEPFYISNSIGASVSVTITVSGANSKNYTVYNENRNGETNGGGVITDSFNINDVHIYDIAL